jgi:RimJ/RimL family protein N-acetyltransferase
MCSSLVKIARDAHPTITVTARTLPAENASTKILKKNGFVLSGVVIDEEDGEVFEWHRSVLI